MARVVDHNADRARYLQLADIIREQIKSGELAPGARLPSEPRLVQIHDLGRETVRSALDILRAEGLVMTVSGVGTEVREQPERNVITVRRDARVWMGWKDGVPVLILDQGSGEETHPADSTTIEFSTEEPQKEG
jgi:DNA-binding transcriptional regulator YhcF (GntR family)